MPPYKCLRITDSVLNFIKFSKECSSSNESELDEKLEKAVTATLERLVQLDVIPQKFNITQSNSIYTLSDTKVATMVDVIFNYYNLNSNSYEKKKEIRDKIRQEHQLRKLKPEKVATLHKKLVKKTIQKEDCLIRPKITIKAKTPEELAEKLRLSIWGLLDITVSETERVTGYEICNLCTREIDGNYEAVYTYRLFKEKIIEKPQSNRYEGEEK